MAAQTFGKYIVTRRLGRGGMAEVYCARHPTLDREVAIKVIHPHLASEAGFTDRFCREAKLVASLRHPHVVQLYDFDVVNDQPFMVMEYLEGGTLKARLMQNHARGTTMPLDQVARYLNAIASALDYAHAHGAVHRDIKPANILFTAPGEPVLSDFGIAKIMGESLQFSTSSAIIGTPAYMSPEQAASKPVDVRSDLYSLGIVLYEMVTGHVPFEGDSPTAVMLQHLTTPPPPPRQFNPNIPEPVQAVILKALAKNPDSRFQSGGELARAFDAAWRGEAILPAAVVSTQVPTVMDKAAAPNIVATQAPAVEPQLPVQPPAPPALPPQSIPGRPAQRMPPATPPPPISRRPTRRSQPRIVVFATILGGVIIAGLCIGAFLTSTFLSLTSASSTPTSIAQATLTRALDTVTATRALPTNPLPLATPIVTLRPSPAPTVTPSPSVGTFGSIIFAPGVIDAGPNSKPVDPGTHFPEGISQVYAFFSYEGTLKKSQWRYERYLDGKLQADLSNTGWDLTGPGATWTSLWNADGVRAGEWEFRLYVMDQVVQKGTFTIERTKPGAASFGVIRFAEGIKDNQPVNPHRPIDNFKTGTTQVYAFFDAANMTKQTIWKYAWYRDDKQIEGAGGTRTWIGNPSEKGWSVKIPDDKGLGAGTYELKLYIEDKLVQLGTFVIQ
jgi:serine/threonine protein kinase